MNIVGRADLSRRELLAGRFFGVNPKCAGSVGDVGSRCPSRGGFVIHPNEVRATMQAQGVEVNDSSHAAKGQSLVMRVAGDVFAAVRKEAPASLDGRSRRRLQRREGHDPGQEKTLLSPFASFIEAVAPKAAGPPAIVSTHGHGEPR